MQNERERTDHYIKPMLARESENAFDDNEWIFEIKWDGYRAIAEVNKKDVRFYSRNGISFKNAYLPVYEDLKKIKDEMILDGEVVVLDKNGRSDFQRLQHYATTGEGNLCYYVFDILSFKKKNICDWPLLERKKLLQKILKQTSVIKYADHISGNGNRFFKTAQEKGLEGIMAKKVDSAYLPGKRTSEWLKIKVHHTQEAIIAGYTKPTGSRKYFGALVLGMYEEGKLIYVGHTGSGFTEKSLKDIFEKLHSSVKKKSPFTIPVKTNAPVTWITPKYVCEIKYTEWTNDHKMRHPIFLHLRKDKNPKEVTMAGTQLLKKQNKKPGKKTGTKSNVKTTDSKSENEAVLVFGNKKVPVRNSSKIYFPEDKITKQMVVDYYQEMADYILPYLKDRPESLRRNPNGISDEGFFQKDAGENAPSWVKTKKIFSESAKKEIDYVVCNDKATLAYLNNLGCIELNPWNSTIQKLDKPDYMILDIDPSEKNSFDEVVETANAFREILEGAGAESYCKTSGATGLHIFVPMGKKYPYEQVKDFAHILCSLVADSLPFTTLERNLKKRGNKKIYLDYLQNRRGQTLASAYSLRPKKGATVSMPLHWKQVKKGLDPADFNIHTAIDVVKKNGDIFKGVFSKAVDIKKFLEKNNGI
jgi:bifunctional non-homologous end joining protein LigD